MSYELDRQWSDKFINQICRLVGQHLVSPAPDHEDMSEATDLIILRAKDLRIGARLRRPGYWDRYPYEFTLRSRRDSGSETEMSKVVNGWGDALFYGHVDSVETSIEHWWLIDLDAFRSHLIRKSWRDFGIRKDNRDGTYFMAFDLRKFPGNPSILMAHSPGLSLRSVA